MVAQISLEFKDIPTGMAIMIFSRFLGGSTLPQLDRTSLRPGLRANIAILAPQLDANVLFTAGATQIRDVVPKADLPQTLQACSDTVTTAFVSLMAASAVSWYSRRRED